MAHVAVNVNIFGNFTVIFTATWATWATYVKVPVPFPVAGTFKVPVPVPVTDNFLNVPVPVPVTGTLKVPVPLPDTDLLKGAGAVPGSSRNKGAGADYRHLVKSSGAGCTRKAD